MSKVYADKIEPRDSSMDVTIGTSTNTVTLAGNDLRANTVKDSGGNTLWTSDGSGNLSSVNSALTGNLKLLSTQTASGDASLSFASGINSTYDVYLFKWITMGPATDGATFEFQGSSNTGTSYGVSCHSTFWRTHHNEGGTDPSLAYDSASDLNESTSYQRLQSGGVGNAADENCSGELYLFSPSNTTYLKSWYSTSQGLSFHEYGFNCFACGHFATTSVIDALNFKFSSGNMDGTMKMYGIL